MYDDNCSGREIMEYFAQGIIFVFGATAIWLVGRLEKWSRWGYICGMISQPAWYYTAYINEQWGIFFISFFYTYSWCQGIYNHWIKQNG